MDKPEKQNITPPTLSEYERLKMWVHNRLDHPVPDIDIQADPEKADAIRIGRDLISGYDGPDRVVSSEEMAAILAAETVPTVTMKTGFPSLDKLIDGVQGGEMIVIGGKRKEGKTTFCQSVTRNLSQDGIGSLWFSYEVPPRQFLSQLPSNTVFYLPVLLARNTLDWIGDRIYESKIKHNCKAVFIDHLHYLVDMTQLRNPSLEIGAIVRKIKRMAIDFNVAVFLVSHVRGVSPGENVTEDHLRDSAWTAAEADSTWIVNRMRDKKKKDEDGEPMATNIMRISVRNHRRNGVMARSVRLVKLDSGMEEYHDEEDSSIQESDNSEVRSVRKNPSRLEGNLFGHEHEERMDD